MSKEAAIRSIGIILSSYPSANREGIENFYKLASESLSEFPAEILDVLAHPKHGIVTKSSFIPSIAEMRKFCVDEIGRRHKINSWERQEEARRLYAPKPVEDPQVRETIVSGLRQLSHELGSPDRKSLLTVEEERAKAERRLEQYAEMAKEPQKIELSPALKKLLFGGQNNAD
jgi:hypothetical protein